MKKRHSIISSILFCIMLTSFQAQEITRDRGNINIHAGTIFIYSTYSLGYESTDFIKRLEEHQLRSTARIGGWNANFLGKNSGLQFSLGITYLYGKGSHLIEHSSEIVPHFDRGLKGQPLVFITSAYRPFIGYRYQPEEKNYLVRIGIGWREVMQFGFGYRF